MQEDDGGPVTTRRGSCLKRLGLGVLSLAALCGVGGLMVVGVPCVPTGLRYGAWLDACPVGMRLSSSLAVHGVGRGLEGLVVLRPNMLYLRSSGRSSRTAVHRGLVVRMDLLDEQGEVVLGDLKGSWHVDGGSWARSLDLPELPEGNYELRAQLTAPFDEIEVKLPLALFSSAVATGISDRPLYQPGDDVLVRAVTLRATDHTPLDDRPGVWTLLEPEGREMWTEKGRTNDWGVAHTSFPLEFEAARGTWKAVWSSGDSRVEIPFEVRPYELPRMSGQVSARQRWAAPTEPVRFKGSFSYASGAPLRDVEVSLKLQTAGSSWPIPLSWEALDPVRTDDGGRFEVDLGMVPVDLTDRTDLTLVAVATDPTGERSTAIGRIVLSPEALKVEVVTELEGGLVAGFNNRAYLRVTTPDGSALAGEQFRVRTPSQSEDEGRVVETDEDGVAALQIDPGEPITIVMPASIFRVRPVEPDPPRLRTVQSLASDGSAHLGVSRALEGALEPIDARCSPLVTDSEVVAVVLLRIGRSGAIEHSWSEGPVADCVAEVVRSRVRFEPGAVRTFRSRWGISDPLLPRVTGVVRGEGDLPDVEEGIDRALRRARGCVASSSSPAEPDLGVVHWRQIEGRTSLEMDTSALVGPGDVQRCLRRELASVRLSEAATGDGLGLAELAWLDPSVRATPQDAAVRTRIGYQLDVVRVSEPDQQGTVVLEPGSVPPLRIRVEPALAAPGEELLVKVFRGPDFRGGLPEEVRLTIGGKELAKGKLDPETRRARLVVPDDHRGFAEVVIGQARGMVFVEEPEPLSVSLQTDSGLVRPGSTVTLTVETLAGDKPISAAVGLIGVDATLGQLVTLPGADVVGRALIDAEQDEPAFGLFTPASLALGQVRGDEAARATLLRIGALPLQHHGEPRKGLERSDGADLETERRDAFLAVLSAVYDAVAEWEDTAAEDSVMTPERMLEIWRGARDRLEEAGEPVRGPFGEVLELRKLPEEWIEQVNPRRVVAEATRLPEDVEDWQRFVRRSE